MGFLLAPFLPTTATEWTRPSSWKRNERETPTAESIPKGRCPSRTVCRSSGESYQLIRMRIHAAPSDPVEGAATLFVPHLYETESQSRQCPLNASNPSGRASFAIRPYTHQGLSPSAFLVGTVAEQYRLVILNPLRWPGFCVTVDEVDYRGAHQH